MSTTIDALCMMAHPDDAELQCGGTLIKLKDQGYTVGIVDFSQGEMSTRGSVEERIREAARAAEIMGVAIRINLKFPDAYIENSVENRRNVVQTIRSYKPSLIITHDVNNRNPDHTNTSLLVKEASFTSGLAKYDTGHEPHRPNKVLYSMEYFDFEPTIIVDITGQYERKMNAISCYSSQTYNPDYKDSPTYIASGRFLKELEARLRFYGSKIHKEYGEAFRMDSPVEIDDIMKEIALRALIPGQGKGR